MRSDQEKQGQIFLLLLPTSQGPALSINENYCVNVLKAGLLAERRRNVKCVWSPDTDRKTIDIQTP